jgi:hypothetical protein
MKTGGFLRDETPKDAYGPSDGKRHIANSIFVRLLVWLAIWWIASFVFCWLTPFWHSQSLGFQITDVIFSPLEWIISSSMNLSVIASVDIFSSKSTVLCLVLMAAFGFAIMGAILMHLRLFLRAKRVILYALIIIQLLMAVGGAADYIYWREMTALVLPITRNAAQ